MGGLELLMQESDQGKSCGEDRLQGGICLIK